MEISRAALYDLRTKAIDKDRFAIEMLIDPTAGILEVGCGTGRILKWLAERNHSQIVGVELRSDFIEIAQQKLDQLENVQLINEDFLRYQSISSIDYVLFAFNVIGEFKDNNKRVEVLKHAKSLLTANGAIIVIYDIPKENDNYKDFEVYNFKIGGEDNVWDVSLECRRDFAAQLSFCKVTYTNAFGDVVTDEYTQASITRDELLENYEAAGLRLEQEYGSYGLDAYNAESEVLIHVLR